MPPTVPLEQALAQAREIKALTAEVANLNRLRVRLSEDSQMHLDRAKIAEADVQALAEALEQAARGRHDWHDKDIVYPQAFEICTAGACERARAALARDGVRRGREEGR